MSAADYSQVPKQQLCREFNKAMALVHAVGRSEYESVPESVYKAYKQPDAYRVDELYRLEATVSALAGLCRVLIRDYKRRVKDADITMIEAELNRLLEM